MQDSDKHLTEWARQWVKSHVLASEKSILIYRNSWKERMAQMTNNKMNWIQPAMKLGDNVKALKCVDWFQSIWHGGTWKLVFVMYLPILPILWLPAGDSINYVSSWRNLLQGIWLDRVPVSVSRMIIWIFCSDTSDHQRSFVLIHSLVMMSTSPVSTVIFPKSETAMLSRSGNQDIDSRNCKLSSLRWNRN